MKTQLVIRAAPCRCLTASHVCADRGVGREDHAQRPAAAQPRAPGTHRALGARTPGSSFLRSCTVYPRGSAAHKAGEFVGWDGTQRGLPSWGHRESTCRSVRGPGEPEVHLTQICSLSAHHVGDHVQGQPLLAAGTGALDGSRLWELTVTPTSTPLGLAIIKSPLLRGVSLQRGF